MKRLMWSTKDSEHTSPKWRKVLFVVGSLLVLLPNALTMYWGNMSVYVLSYMVQQNVIQATNVETPWFISLFIMFVTAGVLLFSYGAKFFGFQRSLLAGVLMSEAGILASHLAVQRSLLALYLTLGGLLGLGSGVIYGFVIQVVVEWAHGDLEMLLSVVQTAYPLSGILVNVMVTWYANPRNEAPTMELSSSKYFTQTRILDKVPNIFIILGSFAVIVQVISMFLLKPNTWKKATLNTDGSNVNQTSAENGHGQYGSQNRTSETETVTQSQKKRQMLESPGTSGNNEVSDRQDIDTLRGILKTTSFYVLWFVFFCAEYSVILSHNYYKLFGQIYIHDDHFLTQVGTVMIILNVVLKLVCGYAMTTFTPKICFLFMLFSASIFSQWFYFSVFLGPWTYFLAAVVYGGSASAMYSIFVNLIAMVYGDANMAFKYGVLRSSSVVLNLVAPEVIEFTLSQHSWFVTFETAAIINVISLVLVAFCLPDKRR